MIRRTSRIAYLIRLTALLALAGPVALACLRQHLDARAVQWSTAIVQGRLSSISHPTLSGSCTYRLYDFQITASLDGPLKPGDTIQLMRFFVRGAGPPDLCSARLSADHVGKTFLLLLRPESSMPFSPLPKPTTAPVDLPRLKAYVPVHLELSDDLSADAMADFKQTISEVRAAEAQVTDERATTAAQTLVQAADDTEAGDAEHDLLQMGPKALPAVQAVFAKASDAGRSRLKRVLDDLTPPEVPVSSD